MPNILTFARLQHGLRTVFAADYCPTYIPWGGVPVSPPIQRIRRAANRAQFGQFPWIVRITLKGIMLVWWPVRVGVFVVSLTRRFGAIVQERTGKGLWRQIVEQLQLSFGLFLSPRDYYRYHLYLDHQRVQAGEYLQNHDRAGLGWCLNALPRHEAIENKIQFARVCAQHGIASVPICAITDTDGIVSLTGKSEIALPQQDLFLKPAQGARGEGSRLLQWNPPDQYQQHDGTVFAQQELTAYLLQLGQERAYLVQPRLTNHPALADVTNGALATVRLVTGRLPDGEIVLIAATLNMPFGQAIISTFGLHSSIDLETGRLGKGYRYRLLCPGFDVHPDTDAPITGRTLPDWAEATALARQAHRVFAGTVFLGWDIAFTPRGPVILEGNSGWDVVMVQMPQRTPLGQTRFVEVCLAHMDLDL